MRQQLIDRKAGHTHRSRRTSKVKFIAMAPSHLICIYGPCSFYEHWSNKVRYPGELTKLEQATTLTFLTTIFDSCEEESDATHTIQVHRVY